MKLSLQLKKTDGEILTVTASVPDFVAWERKTKNKTSDLAKGIGVEDLAFLAYNALKRSGENIKPFDGWINEIEEIQEVDDDPKAMN